MKHSGILRIMVVALTLSLLILAIPATPALALTGTITAMSPATGPPGTLVSITGSGYSPNGTPTVWWSGTAVSTTGTVNSAGSLSASFYVPTYPRATYSVTVTSANATVTDTTLTPASFTITPQITLSSASGYVGDNITVTGTGFAASSTVTIYFDSTAVVTTPTITTTTLGTFSAVVLTVPASVRGTHIVQGYDVYGYSPSVVNFTTYSKITVTPASAAVGDNITISGTGFAALQSIAITFDGVAMTTTPAAVTTSSVGSFGPASFTVPARVRGSYTIRAQDISVNYATATFSTTQSITLTPTSGPNGTKVTVNGTGFNASATITTYFDDVPVTTATVVVTTDPTGAFSTSFDIPSSAGGAHQIKASDGTNTDTKTFTVTATISISPTSGYVGMKVTVTGTGFLASKLDVTILFNNVLVKTTSTDTKGVLSTSFDVPAKAAGTYTIRVSDGTNVKDADFT
ncbi:MAG: IPT/TIG domain-containing protein, partial [Dehalococcoidales bacterium]|nr:IPT/TIG domain-containing protein [Dehalococcoidales bacterium]